MQVDFRRFRLSIGINAIALMPTGRKAWSPPLKPLGTGGKSEKPESPRSPSFLALAMPE
jgi:hypothetical protein